MNRRHGRGKRTARLILLIILLFTFGFFLISKSHTKTKFSDSSKNSPACDNSTYQTNSDSLSFTIKSELQGTHGSYAIVVKNLKTNQIYSQNEDEVFDSASLYKLWVMAVVYEQISQGKLKLNQSLSDSYSDLNKYFDIDPALAEKNTGSFSTTLNNALIQMITVSDNYSALILSKTVGLKNLQNFLIQNCFTGSKVGVNGKSPTTSASDVASFFEKLYLGRLANPTQTKAMIELLKQQKFTDKIPKYLPYAVQLSVAHKTGELDPYSHDGGIIYAKSGDYIIVIMSKSDSRDLANERIANVSKAIYFFFNPEDQTASDSATIAP